MEDSAERSDGFEPAENELDSIRFKFFETVAEELFGIEEMGEPMAEIEPNYIWNLLQRYEAELKSNGLLRLDD